MVSAAYYRFMITHDYMIRYEGECDPYTENCFIGCEDDECTIEYYFSDIYRHATDIHRLCGEDITDCEAANTCSAAEKKCSITYCDISLENESCETIPEQSNKIDLTESDEFMIEDSKE